VDLVAPAGKPEADPSWPTTLRACLEQRVRTPVLAIDLHQISREKRPRPAADIALHRQRSIVCSHSTEGHCLDCPATRCHAHGDLA
jgi:hypothetical protein